MSSEAQQMAGFESGRAPLKVTDEENGEMRCLNNALDWRKLRKSSCGQSDSKDRERRRQVNTC